MKWIHTASFLEVLIQSIENFQNTHLISDTELSEKIWLSPWVIWKIKSKKNKPGYTTLRKLKEWGISIPNIPEQKSIIEGNVKKTLIDNKLNWNKKNNKQPP